MSLWTGVERDQDKSRWVAVTHIGRRWATLDNGVRIDKETLEAEKPKGSACPGFCYEENPVWPERVKEVWP